MANSDGRLRKPASLLVHRQLSRKSPPLGHSTGTSIARRSRLLTDREDDIRLALVWRLARPPAEGKPDNMLDLVHSRELPESPLGSNVLIEVEGEPLFVSGSARSVRSGPISDDTDDWRRSDCRRHGRRGIRRPEGLLRRPARGVTSSPYSKPGVTLPLAASSQSSPRRVTLCSPFRRLSCGLKLVRSIRPEKKRSLSSSNRSCEVMPPGASARTYRTASLMVVGRLCLSIAGCGARAA